MFFSLRFRALGNFDFVLSEPISFSFFVLYAARMPRNRNSNKLQSSKSGRDHESCNQILKVLVTLTNAVKPSVFKEIYSSFYVQCNYIRKSHSLVQKHWKNIYKLFSLVIRVCGVDTYHIIINIFKLTQAHEGANKCQHNLLFTKDKLHTIWSAVWPYNLTWQW